MRVAVAGLGRTADLVAAAARQGAQLLVLPEAPDDAPAEPSDGAWAAALAAMAREHGIALVAGYNELCVTGRYGAALLVDDRGRCLANYRQTHVRPSGGVPRARGHWLTTMPLAGRRVGLLIGYDIEFPEPAAALALAGCDTLLVLGGATDEAPAPLLPARARDTGCWLACSGTVPVIVTPHGRAIHATDRSAGLAVADLTPPEPAAAERRLDRRPRLYQWLVEGGDERGRPA
jgi:predicted amidohydrolase